MTSETRAVPCGQCSLCCRGGEAIILHPEDGDDLRLYDAVLIQHPLEPGRTVAMLKQRPDGSCIYITPFGCSIHAKRPMICREFDCRRMVQKLDASPALRRKLAAAGRSATNDPVIARGRELLAKDEP